MHKLAAAGYELEFDPARGGAVLRFDWSGNPVFHPVRGPGMFDTSSFALLPFSNRIAHGRFEQDGQNIEIEPNFPGSDHPHPLHGFAWLAPWSLGASSDDSAEMHFRHSRGAWPWHFSAVQRLTLRPEGLQMDLLLSNEDERPMPYGLGFHPYFPRDADTVYRGRHRGEWQTSPDGLPHELDLREAPRDWWKGAPVASREVDTVYCGREGPLEIEWPSRRYAAILSPSDNLDHSVVYTPRDADYFCVEPVSHRTDAFNLRAGEAPFPLLEPGTTVAARLDVSAVHLG